VDEINFHQPVRLGETVTLYASVNRAFTTSMEIGVLVMAQSRDGRPRRANNAYLTFVALDDQGKPTAVPPVLTATDDERRRHDEALVRRQLRLQHRRSG
jgi:acyl-CoA hydrolase